ncbi:MAG: flagellar hook-length control protein FliK [Sideroxyarcus sp.]
MTNQPISSSTPQAAAVSKPTANAADAGDTQNTQPFGEVLARQIGEPAAKDTKVADKLAADALAQLGADSNTGKKEVSDDKNPGIVAADSATTLPADMLAALLPQAMNTSNTTSANTSGPDVKTDSSAIDATADRGKRGIATSNTTAPGTQQTGVTLKSATATAAVAETPSRGIPVAAAPAGSANRTAPAVELNAAMREAIAVTAQQPTAAPQSNAAALASLQNTAASVAAPALQPVQITVNTPVNQNRWADEFSQKITWLASSNQSQTAELHLNPPQLGPLDVVIKVSGDQATALFTSPHAAVREAVEQAMPRLRDMLADNGITLGNATVSDHAPRDQGQTGTQRTAAQSANDIPDTAAVGNTAARASPISRHNGIVDTFA